MGEEVEKHIMRKYELLQKLGKGVSGSFVCAWVWRRLELIGNGHRRTASCGKRSTRTRARSWR